MRNFFYSVQLWIMVLSISGCGSAVAQNFRVTGQIQGKDTGKVVLHYMDASNKSRVDTATLLNGNFTFQGSVSGASYAYLNADPFNMQDNIRRKKFDRNLFVEPGDIKIVFTYGAIDQATITGAAVQNQWEAYQQQERQDLKELAPYLSAIDSIRTLLRSGSISSQMADQKIKQLHTYTAPIYASLLNTQITYIQKHPDQYISLHLLEYSVSHIPDEQVNRLYLLLSDSVKNSSLGYRFTQYYARYKKAMGNDFAFDKVEMNKPAPSFVLYQKDKDSLTLSQFRGTVVLLEFWELTCLPCLKANPLIEELRKQYNNGDFKVIAVNNTAADEIQKLHSYVKENKLSEWLHVLATVKEPAYKNGLFFGNLDPYYKIGVPRTVLIDRDGNVIYKKEGFVLEEMKEITRLVHKAVRRTRQDPR